MFQYQQYNNNNNNNNHISAYEGQLRSMSSMSTMNSESDSTTFNHSTSSAQTSTNSSPYNYKAVQQGLQQDSIYEEQENSPDLMNTEFYSSDNIDNKNHAQNFRQSMVYSDSFDSQQFQSVRNSIIVGNDAQVPTKLAMTNSPSFSALASILEKKTKFKPSMPSTIHEVHDDGQEDEFFGNPSVTHSTETLTVKKQQDSPNLIQLDDTETNIPREMSFDSILPSPLDPNLMIAPQYYERMKQINNNNKMSPPPKYESMLDVTEPEAISTSPITQSSTIEATPRRSETTEVESPKPLPKLRVNTNVLNSPQYKQRSSSLPILTNPPQQPQPKKKNKFISFFKSSKRSVSSSQVEQSKPSPSIASSRPSPLFEKASPQIPQTISPPPVAKKSTSSTSLFDAFKRKKQTAPTTSKSFSDIPNIQINQAQKEEEEEEEDIHDSFSISTAESNEFNEDFNNLNINQRPISQISNSGSDVFPKSLNPQEVESIVSIERNRSIKSRHSTMSQAANRQNWSLSDAISLNANQEGMYVTYDEREPSIPDFNKSPTSSVLKKSSSMNSLKIDDELEFGEDFSAALEFDDIADKYEQADLNLNFDFDPSNSNQSSPRKTLRPISPNLNTPEKSLKPPLSTKPFNSPSDNNNNFIKSTTSSPLLESPILQNEPFSNGLSPALQPLPTFIQEQTSRPISMSFKGLKAPAFINNKPALTSSSSFASQQSSKKSFKPSRKVGFSSKIVLYDAWNGEDYDRHPDIATCNQLTPLIAQQIKEELNELKSEMEVHEDSQCYTHFY
ncbi:unnamed protein product [Wickerhamomyces anomalus]